MENTPHEKALEGFELMASPNYGRWTGSKRLVRFRSKDIFIFRRFRDCVDFKIKNINLFINRDKTQVAVELLPEGKEGKFNVSPNGESSTQLFREYPELVGQYELYRVKTENNIFIFYIEDVKEIPEYKEQA